MKTVCNLCAGIALLCTLCASVQGESAFQSVIRQAAKVGDDIPLRAVDDVVSPGSRKLAQELVEKTAKGSKKLSYSRKLSQLVENTLKSADILDPSVLKKIDALDDAGKESALLLIKGSDNVYRAVPDIARRAELLKALDADTLCVLGRFDGLVDNVLFFRKGLPDINVTKSGEFFPKNFRDITLDDFGKFFQKTGEKGADFWENQVKPYWKTWLTSGALAAIILLPESYTDYAINAAGTAIKKVVHAGGTVIVTTGDAAGTVIETAGDTVDATIWMIIKSFCSSVTGILVITVAGFVFFVWFFSLKLVQVFISDFISRVRSIIQWLFPKKKPSNKDKQDLDIE